MNILSSYGVQNVETEQYNYIIFAFPLLKDADFVIDFDYTDNASCEMIKSKVFFVIGELRLTLVPKNKPIKLVSSDRASKFLLIEIIDEKFYKVILSDEGSLEDVFTSYEIIKEFELMYPNYRKIEDVEAVRRPNEGNNRKRNNLKPITRIQPKIESETVAPSLYPRVIIDSKERSRIFNLNSIEWLMSSDEMKCISARNIALLISKKEQGNESTFFKNGIYSRSRRNYYNDICGIISSFSIFILVSAFWFKQPKLKK